ncbi:serine hydrolase [Empedobacter falsenii]|uniref:serine hydrolase n=1 Tax=Empedobacter TaxID=59734 RepID=UPI00244ABCD6|nr:MULTISPECIES: serine hydrolase [Empedobacter]MDH1884004.1 serine hydrolase [Empedobacter sp. GD03797]MDM1042313.1 serine hydrolase [Empedobacter brevis]MDM1136310.1 serine hydrolase [Empedobacter sp. R750]
MKNILLSTITLASFTAFGQNISNQTIDQVTENAMKTFDVPGMSVAVIKDGTIVHSKGYGVKSLKTGEKVKSNTNFGIASNSKAFTAAALAILVDEGKIKWDDKVITHIPEFKMYNDYVTKEFTIRDLLTHRSGLGLGAGDLMVWPDGHNFTPKDIISNIQFLKPVSDFRVKYDYDNLLYIIAGVVIERVSGQSWTDFVTKRLLEPIGMTNTAANWHLVKDKKNAIDPHVPIDGKLQVIDRYTNTIFDAAAGIYSNVDDIAKWLQFNLDKGKVNGKQIISEKQMNEMITPQTLQPNRTTPPYNSLFKAYGLGWQLQDMNGKLEVSHTGGLEGIVTQTMFYPQEKLGIVILTNQQSGAAFRAISNTIKDFYLKNSSTDWVKTYDELMKKNVEEADDITNAVWKTVEANQKNKAIKFDVKSVIGTYKDNWFGDVVIYEKKGKIIFESKRSPQLTGEMSFYKDNTFAVKWYNRYFHADAFVFAEMKDGKMTGFKMKAISPLTDFSYDFHDLDFTRK